MIFIYLQGPFEIWLKLFNFSFFSYFTSWNMVVQLRVIASNIWLFNWRFYILYWLMPFNCSWGIWFLLRIIWRIETRTYFIWLLRSFIVIRLRVNCSFVWFWFDRKFSYCWFYVIIKVFYMLLLLFFFLQFKLFCIFRSVIFYYSLAIIW